MEELSVVLEDCISISSGLYAFIDVWRYEYKYLDVLTELLVWAMALAAVKTTRRDETRILREVNDMD